MQDGSARTKPITSNPGDTIMAKAGTQNKPMTEQEKLENEALIKVAKQYAKHQEYMKAYNKRPERAAKRKSYNSARWQKMKQAHKIAKDAGLLNEEKAG